MNLPPKGLVSIKDLLRQPWRTAAMLLIVALFVTNIYRAGTQSITHDEGVMFEWMLSGPWSQVLNSHGNHHVLAELLCKLMINLFGLSEISLRIPTLLGGLLYFYSVFGISMLLFGEAFLFLLSVAFLCLNPLVLDYLVCARGYGLALGFFFYALYQVAQYLAEPPDRPSPSRPPRLLHRAGVALGLSIGSNIIMIFPGTALIACLLAMLFLDALIRPPQPAEEAAARSTSRKESRRRSRHQQSAQPRARGWEQVFLHFALPAAAVSGFLSILPQRLIELEAGYLGPSSLAVAVEGLVRFSLYHSPVGFAGLAAWFRAEPAIWFVTNLLAPAALAGLLIVAIQIAVPWTRKRSLDKWALIDRFLLLLSGMLSVAIVLVVLSRYLFDQPYPELRTAMYWIPLLSLAGLCVLRRLGEGTRVQRVVSVPLTIILLVCVLQYLTQFNARYFAEWSYCAAAKDMMQIVRAQHVRKPETTVRAGATWQLEPVINFYRVAWGLSWMEPVYRESPDNAFDYYLLAQDDTSLVERLHLKTLLRDRLSATVLAKRADL